MGGAFKQSVGLNDTVSSANNVFTIQSDILPDEDIIIAIGKSSSSTTINGALSVSVSSGAIGPMERCGASCRASTFDVHMVRARCTERIPAGATITLTTRSSSTRRGGILAVFSGLSASPAAAHSGNTADNTAGNISGGHQGSGLVQTAPSTPDTVGPSLVVAAFASGGASTMEVEPDLSLTEIDHERTFVGSSDRGVLMAYKFVDTPGPQTASANNSATLAWAATSAAFSIYSPPPPTGAVFKEKTATGWATLTAKEWNGSAWVDLAPKAS